MIWSSVYSLIAMNLDYRFNKPSTDLLHYRWPDRLGLLGFTALHPTDDFCWVLPAVWAAIVWAAKSLIHTGPNDR
jgi:hypothetical protein